MEHPEHSTRPHPQHDHNHHNHDMVGANKEYFDAEVATKGYELLKHPEAIRMNKDVANNILEMVSFDPQTTSVLDFACGFGIVSRELAPYSKYVLGVDISEGVINQFKKTLKELNNEELSRKVEAKCMQLKGESESELDGKKFDVIVCTAAYHHFPSTHKYTKMLAFFLKPGGCLVVSDMATQENQEIEVPKELQTVIATARGYTEKDMKEIYEAGGLTLQEYKVIGDYTLLKDPLTRFGMFVSRAVKL